MSRLASATIATLLLAVGASALAAQGSLASRVAAAPEGRVQFSFPARPGVCGDGQTFITLDGSTHLGTFTSSDAARAACVAGPVRVVLDRAGREIVGVATHVGPVAPAGPGTTDLGTVPAADASAYLLGLAATLDGRPGRDAIMPASLAEGVDASERLTAIARDAARPADTRRSAMSWLAREAATPDAARRAGSVLLELARDDAQPRPIRQQALSVLTRLESGAGIPAVIALTTGGDEWLVRAAVSALARSGDPRARESLREIIRRTTAGDDVVAAAVRGIANEYATSADERLLRDRFAQLPGDASRRAVINALAERGGEGNAGWLLQVAANEAERESVRRSAMAGARRAGVSSAELARVYDRGDNVTRGLVVSALAETPDDAAVQKLLAIARSGDDRAIRRRAVSALGKVDDPKVKSALADIVVR